VIGIVGGVGPLAGAHLYRRLVELTDATTDEEHPSVVLVSVPVPSRIAHLLDGGQSPLPALERALEMLADLGCTVAALASATTHAYRDLLLERTALELVDGIAAACADLASSSPALGVVFCTSAARQYGLYERAWPEGVELAYPDERDQRALDGLIAGVKNGAAPPRLARELRALVDGYAGDGTACLLGCTELPLVWSPTFGSEGIVSISDSIARAALAAAGPPSSQPSRLVTARETSR
jgi:aspartate racemase